MKKMKHRQDRLDTFGDRLRWYARTYYGTLRAFGEAVGRAPSDMTRAVQEIIPSGKELAMWQEKTGIGVSWVLTGVGPRRIIADVGASGVVRESSDLVEEIDASDVGADVVDLSDPDERAAFLDQLSQTRLALLSGAEAIDKVMRGKNRK